MVEIAETPGKPDTLYPSMELLVQVGRMIAPYSAHEGLRAHAEYLQRATSQNQGFRAETRMMRALQDGIDFGKWPS